MYVRFIAGLCSVAIVSGCETTTNAHECADRGVLSTLCHDDVASETDARREQLEDDLAANEDLEAELARKKAEQAELEAKAASLKEQLGEQSGRLTTLRQELDDALEANTLTQADYDGAVQELESLNRKISSFETLPSTLYSAATVTQVETLSVDVDDFVERMKLGGLG